MVITTAEAEQELVEAMEAGADAFLVRPVRPALLCAHLQVCQRLHSLREEVRRDKEEMRRLMANLAVANRQLQQAALTDSLTGLYNRRYATERLDQEWASSGRLHHDLSCMIIDIDHFKRVNDTFGHDVGDLVLREVAETCALGCGKMTWSVASAERNFWSFVKVRFRMGRGNSPIGCELWCMNTFSGPL